jgi:hypothetical protein
MMSSEFNTSDNAIIMGSKGYIELAEPWQASDKLTVHIKETGKTVRHTQQRDHGEMWGSSSLTARALTPAARVCCVCCCHCTLTRICLVVSLLYVALVQEEHKFPIKENPSDYSYPHCSLFQYEAQHMNELFRAGKKESDVMPLAESVAIMGALDEIRKQVGVKLENDNKAPPTAGPKAS